MIKEDDYRKVLTKGVQESYEKLQKAILKLNALRAKEPINKESLEAFPLMVWVPLNDKVKIRKRKNRFNSYLAFDTIMKKEGRFGEHFHEDIIESAEVISGELLDTSTNEVFRSGDIAHYEKGVIHTPIATEDTVLHVLFKT